MSATQNQAPPLLSRKSRVVPMTRADVRRYRLRRGDLLVCEGGEVGRAAIWLDELPECYFQKALHRLRPKVSYEPRLLLAFLEYWASVGAFSNYVTQTSIAHLPREKLVQMPLPLPHYSEQIRLSEVVDDLNAQIAALERLTAKKQAIKQGIMQQLLTGKTRLPGFRVPWVPRHLSDLVSYEQPGRYLVHTSKQLNAGKVPVLTAGKTFVLGYTNEIHGVYISHPVIIFDDFTTASKYVDFDFKAKSSAMKILSVKADVNLRFIYERMQRIDFPLGDHKRHWISEYSKQEILLPDEREQVAISAVIADADAEVHVIQDRLVKAKAVKVGMMQQLLTGRTRLPIVGSAK